MDNQEWEEVVKGIKKIRSKKIPISKKVSFNFNFYSSNETYGNILDLHGYTIDEAYMVLNNFIHVCYNNKVNEILIITGKGSEDRPSLLRVEVRRWLEYTELNKYVISFSYAKQHMGGEGAIRVKIKRRRDDFK